MRSTKDIRDLLRHELRQICSRPEMYAHDGRAVEILIGIYASHLLFIDECDDAVEAISLTRQKFGKLGVIGPFERTFGKDNRYTLEVTSVYAEQLHVLGLLDVDRTLPAEAHRELRDSVRDRFDEKDVRRSEVESEFGPPSFVVGKTIGCYAPADRQPGWVFVDYWTEAMHPYELGRGASGFEHRFVEDPLVRDVRLPWTDWESGIVLTLRGKYLRWGRGWWIDHTKRTANLDTPAIAAQLRSMRDADPSQ